MIFKKSLIGHKMPLNTFYSTPILTAYGLKDPFLMEINPGWLGKIFFKKSKKPCKISQQTFLFQGFSKIT
jgi:hypothetical protein